MNAKIMEGLVGARTNINLVNTPFRVYKEARRKGDTATMERAMGYVNKFSDKADEYKAEADEGIKEDAEAAREKEKLEREKAIQKRREEREKLEKRIEESRDENKETDSVKVSEEGKVLLKENMVAERNDVDKIDVGNAVSKKGKTDKKAVIYTKTGEASQSEQTINISISV